MGPKPKTTLRRVENARRKTRQVCSDVKMTGRHGIFCRARSLGVRAGSRKNWEKIRQTALPLWFRAHAGVSAWVAWHILQGAQSRRSGRKQETLREKIRQTALPMCFRAHAGVSAWVFGHVHYERHRDTHRHAHRLSLSQLQPVSGLQKSFGQWPSSSTRACLYSASARSTVLSPGSSRSR